MKPNIRIGFPILKLELLVWTLQKNWQQLTKMAVINGFFLKDQARLGFLGCGVKTVTQIQNLTKFAKSGIKLSTAWYQVSSLHYFSYKMVCVKNAWQSGHPSFVKFTKLFSLIRVKCISFPQLFTVEYCLWQENDEILQVTGELPKDQIKNFITCLKSFTTFLLYFEE